MLEIGRVFESALRTNSQELRKAAIASVRRIGPDATIDDLLISEAAPEILKLSLGELCDAAGLVPKVRPHVVPRDVVAKGVTASAPDAGITVHDAAPETGPDLGRVSNEERMYREILGALGRDTPMTIGQLSKALGMDSQTLKPFVSWMRDMGKVESIGRARSTRYRLR